MCITECPQGKYGMNCASTCTCNPHRTVSCDKVDGTCSCKAGWEGKDCNADVKECTLSRRRCGANAKCHETPGSFRCTCNKGYQMNARRLCVGMCCSENM